MDDGCVNFPVLLYCRVVSGCGLVCSFFIISWDLGVGVCLLMLCFFLVGVVS